MTQIWLVKPVNLACQTCQPTCQQSRRDNVMLEAGAGRRVADVLIFLINNNK